MWQLVDKYHLKNGEWNIARYRNGDGWDHSLFRNGKFVAHRQTEQECKDLYDELTQNPGMAATTPG